MCAFTAQFLNELVRSERCRRYLCAARLLASRKPQGPVALIKQTQCTTQFCIQVGCPSPRRWFPHTIDRYYLEVQWTHRVSRASVSLSLRLPRFFPVPLILSDASSFHNGFSCGPIFSRSFHDRVDSSADFNAAPDSDAFRLDILRWSREIECKIGVLIEKITPRCARN